MTFERQSLLTPELPNITRLVPLERHLSATRWQFIRGVLIGILVSCAVAIPAFKYANIRQHGASLQNTSGQTPLGNSDAPAASPALKSTSDIAGTSFLPPTLSKPQPSKPSNDSPDNPVKPFLAPPRPQSPLSSPGSQPAQLPPALPKPQLSKPSNDSPVNPVQPLLAPPRPQSPVSSAVSQPTQLPDPEPGRTKKIPATPQQLWSSVQAGNTKAAVALADLYLRGDGVPVNCDQARVLLLVASKENNAEAIKKLQDLEATGCPAP